MKLLGFILGAIVVSAPMQAIPTISVAQALTCQVEFDQPADTLIAANAFHYKAMSSASSVDIPVVCTGTVSPFQCDTPLPDKSAGTHTVSISTSEVLADGTVITSDASAIFTYRVANAPGTPTNLHIKK